MRSGDVHGRLDLLDELLGKIERDVRSSRRGRATLVFLGDLIDRGPQSAEVLERLRTYRNSALRTVFLLGNHEEVLLRILNGDAGLIARLAAVRRRRDTDELRRRARKRWPASTNRARSPPCAKPSRGRMSSSCAALPTRAASAITCWSTPASARASSSSGRSSPTCAGSARRSYRRHRPRLRRRPWPHYQQGGRGTLEPDRHRHRRLPDRRPHRPGDRRQRAPASDNCCGR